MGLCDCGDSHIEQNIAPFSDIVGVHRMNGDRDTAHQKNGETKTLECEDKTFSTPFVVCIQVCLC
jgi:hypothetical protein